MELMSPSQVLLTKNAVSLQSIYSNDAHVTIEGAQERVSHDEVYFYRLRSTATNAEHKATRYSSIFAIPC